MENYGNYGNRGSYILSHCYIQLCQILIVNPPSNVRVCACVMASVSLRGREDTWCVRLGTGSGRETEENVFLQRDCIQSLKTVIWDMNSLHGLSSILPDSVMQQRRLASRSALVRLALTKCRPPSPSPTPPHPPLPSPGPYLRCHNAWLLRVCRGGGLAPSSSESVRWMLALCAAAWGPVQAATMTFPLTVILLPSHSVGHTRGKVFKLNLKGRCGERQKEGKNTTSYCTASFRLVDFHCSIRRRAPTGWFL